MHNLMRITNYYNNLEAQKDWADYRKKLAIYGLDHLMVEPKGDTWRKIDKATGDTKKIEVHLPDCPKCTSRTFTVPLDSVVEAEGFIACDYCDTPLYPIERKVEAV